MEEIFPGTVEACQNKPLETLQMEQRRQKLKTTVQVRKLTKWNMSQRLLFEHAADDDNHPEEIVHEKRV